jgi:hypothetical protein
VAFSAGDTIVARVDNASSTTYSPNWRKHDQTDAVQAVAGLTGSVSQAALLAALGLATTDSPQFAGVNIGHAADTTLTRIAAGRAAIEGDEIARLVATQTLTNKTFQSGSIDGATVTGVREVLSADRTYYVRTDGNDGNDGLSNSPGGAFLTLQKAFDAVAAVDLSTQSAIIQLGAGTYTSGISVNKSWVGGNLVTLKGDSTTPSNVEVATSGHAFVFSSPLACRFIFDGLKLTTSSGDGIRIDASVAVDYKNMDYGAIAGSAMHVLFPGAYLRCVGNYSISGDCQRHWNMEYNSFLRCTGYTITLTGTPNFSVAFADADLNAGMNIGGNTFTGSGTGKRYEVTLNSSMNVSGGGATYLPGNASGTTATGGEYA